MRQLLIRSSGPAVVAALLAVLILSGLAGARRPDPAGERQAIERTIRGSIGWALTKDRELLESCLAHDPDFFIFHPDSQGTITSWPAFTQLVDRVFMRPEFKATGYELRDLRIGLSASGRAAWFSCFLDDFGEWAGEPMAWRNARWTGVLDRRDGRWVIVQMHFSFPTDRCGQG